MLNKSLILEVQQVILTTNLFLISEGEVVSSLHKIMSLTQPFFPPQTCFWVASKYNLAKIMMFS